MKLTMLWFRRDQRSAVAAGLLVLVTQVIMAGSIIRDMAGSATIL